MTVESYTQQNLRVAYRACLGAGILEGKIHYHMNGLIIPPISVAWLKVNQPF